MKKVYTFAKPAYAAALLALFSVLISTSSIAQSGPGSFVTFAAFLKGIVTADAATYLGHPESRVVSATEFEAMRGHVLSLYEGVQVSHSFVYNSQYVDCVPVLQQPSARLLDLKVVPQLLPPAPPPAGMPTVLPTTPQVALGQSDSFGNRISCDDGTIPMRRITLEELSRFQTLHDYFRKAPGGTNPSPALDYAGFKHRTLSEYVNNIGAASQLELWYPTVNTSTGQYHSLSQMWVVGYSTAPEQTAEAGWQVAPLHYNTNAAVPFIYWTADGYLTTGCYNLECAGFVQLNNKLILGVPNWSTPSQPGGQQVVINLQWQAQQNPDGTLWGWALYYNCTPSNLYTCGVGYYPISTYGSGQLSKYSNHLQFGGETYTSTHALFGQMGSGALPSAGPPYAAYQSNAYYVYVTSPGTHSAAPCVLGYDNFPQTDSCYGEAVALPSCGSPPLYPCNSFYFGGSGGTNCGGG